jgi:hypothetical protein
MAYSYNPPLLPNGSFGTISIDPEYKFHEPPTNTIICMAGSAEMLKIGPDGFWVRGVKVEQDDKEAETVYNAFKQWMMWAKLNER